MINPGNTKTKERRVEKEAEEHREQMRKEADEVTISSVDSFPASDPPSFNPGITGASDVHKKKKKK
jgi:hypothetical protein